MNKKFLSAILFGALMVTSTGTFVSCKDYDDDIENLQSQIDANSAAISELKNLVQNNDYVTGIEVSGSNLVVSFKNAGTKTLALPKDEKGSLCQVVDGVLYIDGTATDIKVCETPVVEESEFLPAVKIENGEWAVLQEDNTYASTGIAASSIAIAENTKGGYTLTVKDSEGVETEVELPATKVITDLTATTIANGKMGKAEVILYYGKKIEDKDGLTFNGKTYAKGTYLISQNAALSAIVNPLDADATKYTFKLVDTKDNAPIVVSDIKQNMSEKALSRAESVNQGVWDMTLAFADATDVDVDGTYALTTETTNGVVASPYDVTVKAEKVSKTGIFVGPMKVEGNCNADIDIAKGFYAHELGKYIVDSYFEITDKTAANNAGVTLDENIIKTTKNETFTFNKVKGYFLLVNGARCEVTINVTFKKVTPTASLSDVEWTITDKTDKGQNVVYLSLSAIQSQLVGSSDAKLPAMSENGYTWADGVALDDKSVVVNGAYYGKAVSGKTVTKFAGNEESWITTLNTQLYTIKDSKYVAATSIQDDLYAAFTFDYKKAFPGEYIIKVAFRKDGATSGDYTLEVPVKVTINAPEVNPFSRLTAYFNGDEATAYGKVANGYVDYNLFDLFQPITDKTNVSFTETKHDNTTSHTCAAWIITTGNKGDIKVAVYDADKTDNTDGVYTTRAMKAVYTVFGNAHIAKVVDEFNLTVKSEIFEGTLEASADASVSGQVKDVMKVDMKNITAKDVYGVAYNLADTYVWNATTETYDKKAADDRIASVVLKLADDNAEQYLAEPSAIKVNEEGTPYFEVKSLSDQTALQSDVVCKLELQVTDVWGKTKTTEITVTLKK